MDPKFSDADLDPPEYDWDVDRLINDHFNSVFADADTVNSTQMVASSSSVDRNNHATQASTTLVVVPATVIHANLGKAGSMMHIPKYSESSNHGGPDSNLVELEVHQDVIDVLPELSDPSDEESTTNCFPNGPQCPGDSCRHNIPSTPHPKLAARLEKYKRMYKKYGRNSKVMQWPAMDICVFVNRERLETSASMLALENNWPVSSIDFKAIPRHIIVMQLQISSIVFDRKS